MDLQCEINDQLTIKKERKSKVMVQVSRGSCWALTKHRRLVRGQCRNRYRSTSHTPCHDSILTHWLFMDRHSGYLPQRASGWSPSFQPLTNCRLGFSAQTGGPADPRAPLAQDGQAALRVWATGSCWSFSCSWGQGETVSCRDSPASQTPCTTVAEQGPSF